MNRRRRLRVCLGDEAVEQQADVLDGEVWGGDRTQCFVERVGAPYATAGSNRLAAARSSLLRSSLQ
jgi:hypothetical protein